MDISLVMDQLLENTTLLANPSDAEANYLLSWIRRALPSLIGAISDETLGWQKVELLKETLRAASSLIARYRTASEQTFLELLRAFLRQYAQTFERYDALQHPVVPELAEIMRAQPDDVSALRALLDFAENVRPPDFIAAHNSALVKHREH
jgi:choline dehydrogenase-like flavoprotein